ncbi:hypothetical protein V3N99_10190 [Dermatophilaceae bacterium Soc4.6]
MTSPLRPTRALLAVTLAACTLAAPVGISTAGARLPGPRPAAPPPPATPPPRRPPAACSGSSARAGAQWTLQGLSYVGRSAMSGNSVWAVVGPVVVVVGAVAAARGWKGRSATRP